VLERERKISLGGKSIAGFKSFEVRTQYSKDVLIPTPTHPKYMYSIIIKSHTNTHVMRIVCTFFVLCFMFFVINLLKAHL
jgi:hypothetical protein